METARVATHSPTVLVTGCSSGLGRATAQAMVERGWTVFASMRDVAGRNAAAARELVEWAQARSATAEVLELDVTVERSIAEAVSRVIERTGRIDVVVNSAGVGAHGITEAFTVQQAQALFDVNVFGALRVNRAVLPYMRRQHSGLLIHVSSTLGRFIMPFSGLYSATKFALEALAEGYRLDLMASNVDSVIVEPGACRTRFHERLQRPEDGAVNAEYGRMAELADQTADGFAAWMAGQSTADVAEVASAIVELVECRGQPRATRTPVGRGAAGVSALNEVTSRFQARMIDVLGVSGSTR
jgi:NAD(P)-dependent dehydrogenase (short-subunit alcohol dehydrogenase family)